VAIELTVVTPEGEAFAGPVEEVVLPGSEGEFGVLALHERFLAPLQPGVMEIRTAAGASVFNAVSDGFADVNAERVVVMVDSCQRADEIEVDVARESQSEAEAALAALGIGEEDDVRRAELQNQLDRATAAQAAYAKGH
jgi:F-type H+-transporting ATPase subunit epsilon